MSTAVFRWVLATLLYTSSVPRAVSPKNHAGWWVETFGVLEPTDDARVEIAREVFDRVMAAADVNSTRHPRLLVIRENRGPFALALPDGTVILTRGGIDACFRAASAAQARSRLAFLLGHELAHLAHDDFWHAFASAALADFARDPRLKTELDRLLAESPDEAQTKELQADSYGMLYMVSAGYDPAAVIGAESGFLDAWTAFADQPTDAAHPRPSARRTVVRAVLEAVANEADLFHLGVRLYQLGRYEDAVVLLGAFLPRYGGREVQNAIGLAQYQLAGRVLAGCGPDEVVRFRFPTQLDRDTLAKRMQVRGSARCRESPAFRRRLAEAIRYLDLAVRHDPNYVPARVNLASARLLAGEYALGLGAAEDALRLAPGDPAAQEVKAIALYLWGWQARIDTVEPAMRLLGSLRLANPSAPGPAYNLARMQSERGRTAAAREAWKRFLTLEADGPFADAARSRLGHTGADRSSTTGPAAAAPPSPLALGPVQAGMLRQLGLGQRPFDFGNLRGATYRGNGLRALQINGSVEIVEQMLDPSTPAGNLSRFGPPLRQLDEPGSRTLVYRNFAVDLVRDSVVARVYFVP